MTKSRKFGGARKPSAEPRKSFGEWSVKEKLGAGGNGTVWSCSKPDGSKAAVKVLTKIKEIAYQRFRDEVKVLNANREVPGVLPILEQCLPEEIGGHYPWYAMPLAIPLEEWAKTASSYQRVMAIIEAAKTMAELHKRGIFHRDIKPANLVYYNDRCCVVDFGLVDYPGKIDLTGKGEQLGPKWTMAPEVRRDGPAADPAPGDVYSLAKSLWIILKDVPFGFDGEYTKAGSLAIAHLFSSGHTGILDALLADATSNDPKLRPSIDEFAARLSEWASLAWDYHKRNPIIYRELFKELFPFAVPDRAVWTDVRQIASVLNRLGKAANLNHTFFPGGGGLDLESACVSEHELGCIEMFFPRKHIVKPLRLIFEGFPDDPDWNYFRLEAGALEPCPAFKENNSELDEGLSESETEAGSLHESYDEEGTEISPGVYAPFNCYEYGEFEGQELPETAHHIVRCLGGAFVIFSKTSFYNYAPGKLDAYDGRHNRMTCEEFRAHIEEMRTIVRERNIDWLTGRRQAKARQPILSSAVDLKE